jgi:hypothetical protein
MILDFQRDKREGCLQPCGYLDYISGRQGKNALFITIRRHLYNKNVIHTVLYKSHIPHHDGKEKACI